MLWTATNDPAEMKDMVIMEGEGPRAGVGEPGQGSGLGSSSQWVGRSASDDSRDSASIAHENVKQILHVK